MRLNHLDILEQCFRNQFKGYNKEEVEEFLKLVAADFQGMSEEIQQLKREVEQKNQIIDQLKGQNPASEKTDRPDPRMTPEFLKEKAKKVIRIAREQAENHKKKAEQDLDILKKEIHKLTTEKSSLIKNLKETAWEHLKRNMK